MVVKHILEDVGTAEHVVDEIHVNDGDRVIEIWQSEVGVHIHVSPHDDKSLATAHYQLDDRACMITLRE